MHAVSYRGRIDTVEPFDVYKKYLALKSHFSNKSYDYFKYNGNVKASKNSFETRRDKYFFYKLSKQKNVEEFLLANFVDGDKDFWIGNLRDDKVAEVYQQYKKRQQSLSYTFKSDLGKMKESFDDNIIVPPNEHPYLLRLFLRKDICIETLTILDLLCNIYKYWDKELDGDVVWPDIKQKSLKYRPFMSVDINKYRDIVISHFR